MIKINGRYGYVDFVNEKGENHRLNGAAFIDDIDENYQAWWSNGKRHRLDGPAVIDGNKQEWHIKGIQYTEHEYHNKLKEMELLQYTNQLQI